MTLFRELFLGVSIAFVLLLAGTEAIYLESSRAQFEERLASQAQDAATSLALRLGTLRSLEDPVLLDRIASPLFDRGYFLEIRIVGPEGEPLLRKSLPLAQGDVPEWFTRLFPLGTPSAQALVSSGWRELGRVAVVSHPNFTYQQLWHAGLRTLAWLLVVYALAVAGVVLFLAMLLRPLREIERTALAIGGREFRTIAVRPRTRDLARVVDAINGMSGKIGRIVAEETGRAEALRRAAFVDPLTSLYNRRGFEQELESRMRSRAEVFSAALALVELRGFAEFNAHAGYQRADEILALVASTLADTCRKRGAIAGRLGGAGFAFAAVNLDAAALQALVAEVCARLQALFAEQGIDSQLHCQCGATREEGVLPALPALLGSADGALQRAREKGPNEYDIEEFDASAAGGSHAWRERIERALAENGVVLFEQAVFGLPARRPVHQEIMARLREDHGDPVPAAQFLPMAVRHGLIGRVDLRVVELVVDRLARGTLPPSPLAINLSAHTIADAQVTARILALLDARGAPGGRIIFELTEYGALQDPAAARRFAAEARRRGAHLAVDNFGMQHNSLMLVHALKPDYIKLSAGYTRQLAADDDCRFFVASLVRIAQPLGIGIFAQAVEDKALLPALAELGLSGYQGYVEEGPHPVNGQPTG